jgi:hypothetical protein
MLLGRPGKDNRQIHCEDLGWVLLAQDAVNDEQ